MWRMRNERTSRLDDVFGVVRFVDFWVGNCLFLVLSGVRSLGPFGYLLLFEIGSGRVCGVCID